MVLIACARDAAEHVRVSYVARLSERGVAEPMELATLLQRVNSQRVATVQA